MTVQQNALHMIDRAERAASAGDLAFAAELLRGALHIQEEELGPLHPDLANTLNNLAIVAEKTGSSSEAESLYRRAAAIAAAALPSDHPMVVASRQNLEDFCRARGLSMVASTVITPTYDESELHAFASEDPAKAGTMPVRPVKTAVTANAGPPPSVASRPVRGAPATIAAQPLPPTPNPRRASHALEWVAGGAVIFVAAVLLVWRPWSPREASSPAPTTQSAPAQPTVAMPPQTPAPPSTVAAVEESGPPTAEPPREDRNVATVEPPAAGGITLATAQLCRTLSTSGPWRCDPAGDPAPPGPMTFYTRVRTPRDTTVVHRWYRGDTLRQSVTLRIRASATEGYRTYSRQTVDDGDWRLEVRSADGELLHEHRFAVR